MEIEKKHGEVVVTIKLSPQDLDNLKGHIQDLEMGHCSDSNCPLWTMSTKL